MTSTLLDLGAERFVSLTTFRKTGERVSTPVWIARSGDALFVTTPALSGKVKRLRNSDRVELVPCSRLGKVDEGATPVAGSAEIVVDAAATAPFTRALAQKYGLEFRIMSLVERFGRNASAGRVILRITAP
jgi:PPOX class probable F420-dependent enzyme